MNELNDTIYKGVKHSVTISQLQLLFGSSITPEKIFLTAYGLNNGTIAPDQAMIQVIYNISNELYVILLALCLRFGADPNLHIDTINNSLGKIHVIAYLYNIGSKKVNNTIVNTCALLLLLSGSNVMNDIYTVNKTNESVTVEKWLDSQGYKYPFKSLISNDISGIEKVVTLDSMRLASLLLNNPKLYNGSYKSTDLTEAIRYHSPTCIEDCPISYYQDSMDYCDLRTAVHSYNYDAIKYLLIKKEEPSYLLVNTVIYDMKDKKGKVIIEKQLQQILLLWIKNGVKLDNYHLQLLSIHPEYLIELKNEYQKPYWIKVCNGDTIHGNTSEELHHISDNLGITSDNKQYLCRILKKMNEADPNALLNASKKMVHDRLASEVYNPLEYMGGNYPPLVCMNMSMFNKDILDVNPNYIAAYKNENDSVYCFPASMFDTLIDTKMNPYDNTKLPNEFIGQMKCKKQSIDNATLGLFNSSIPMTFNEALIELKKNDIIDSKTSDHTYQQFINIANRSSISKDAIESIPRDKLLMKLKSVTNINDSFTDYSNAHLRITIAYIIVHIYNRNKDCIKEFFTLS